MYIRPLSIWIIITTLLGLSLTFAQGLKPLQPSQFSSRSLHSEPTEASPILRELENSDRITVLRSINDWYEIDIQTSENLNFRGWLKGSLAAERLPPPALDTKMTKKEDPQPLASKDWVWFWDRRAHNPAHLDVHLGGQAIFYKLEGAVTGGRNTIYDYDFSGFSFGLSGALPILKTRLWDRDFIWLLEASYFYGLFGLSFGSDFSVSELQGVGYRVDTHTYRAQSLAEIAIIDNTSNSLYAGAGLGFYSHEVAPDLQPIRSGTYAGQLVFVESAVQALSVPLRIEGKASTDWMYGLTVAPLLFASVSETGSQTPDLDASGFSYVATGTLGYEWSRTFATFAEFEQLSTKASSKRTGLTRLGTDYAQPDIALSYLRGTLAFRFAF